MRHPDFEIQELIEMLEGSSVSIDDQIQGCLTMKFEQRWPDMYESDLTVQELDTIDNQIFKCETCGWWYPIDEMDEEQNQICEDCGEDN